MFFNGNSNNYSCYNDQNELPMNNQSYGQNSYIEYVNDGTPVQNNNLSVKNDRLIKDPKISNGELLSFFSDILKNQFNMRDRVFLLDLEKTFVDLINHQFLTTFSFPPMGSYHRMLVHRTASYFNLGHYADESGRFVIVQKITTTKCPEILLSKMAEEVQGAFEEQTIKPKLILKRQPKNGSCNTSIDTKIVLNDLIVNKIPKESASMPPTSLKTFEQREEEYLKARARIFNDHEQQCKDVKLNDSDTQKSDMKIAYDINKTNDDITEIPVSSSKLVMQSPFDTGSSQHNNDLDKITESIKSVSVNDIKLQKVKEASI